MHIAYVMAEGRGETDLLLYDLARAARARGLSLAGTVQVNSNCGDDRPCDMDVEVLPDGPVIRISQSLGPGAKGCRLDPSQLELAVAAAEARLAAGCDLVIVNKFGKHEAEGRGFRGLIGEALARDVPVLVGVNRLNIPHFLDFIGAGADLRQPVLPDLLEWLDGVHSPA
ncbi:DUF2478 domain-containing protein [uncultured Roseovarius sp.]|uniref:DUF2478 domain-containing protein n=1 Tax=uncultured Roseovarius sp. TaxID=293344 RepID=UPI00260E8690|nr:DUF2478 domain-containing protein [uncultured Roseovarius sp.]